MKENQNITEDELKHKIVDLKTFDVGDVAEQLMNIPGLMKLTKKANNAQESVARAAEKFKKNKKKVQSFDDGDIGEEEENFDGFDDGENLFEIAEEETGDQFMPTAFGNIAKSPESAKQKAEKEKLNQEKVEKAVKNLQMLPRKMRNKMIDQNPLIQSKKGQATKTMDLTAKQKERAAAEKFKEARKAIRAEKRRKKKENMAAMRVRQKLIEEGRMVENKGTVDIEERKREFKHRDDLYNEKMQEVMHKVEEKGYLIEESKLNILIFSFLRY